MLPTLLTNNESRPRFEFYPVNCPTLKTVFIESTPFTIGRGEENDLQINSTSVSRVHAELARTRGGYAIRDTGSTNGTCVNGQAVTESALQDGDALQVADVELTFVCSSLGRLQRMVTQPLACKPSARPLRVPDGGGASRRCLNEALLWLATPLRHNAIVDLRTRHAVATLTSIDEPLASALAELDSRDPRSTAARVQSLAWRVAAEGASGPTLLQVEQRSRLDEQLLEDFEQAHVACAADARLGVFFPWEWAADTKPALRLCDQLRSLGARIVLNQFSGSAACVETLSASPPDLLVFAPEVVSHVATQPRRLRRLEIVQASCEAAGIQTVLPGGVNNGDLQTCEALGIGLGVDAVKSTADRPAAFALV